MPTFVAPVAASTPRKTLAPGTYQARCVQMLLLGTHAETYQGETKPPVQKIRLGWEFPTEMETFQEDKGPQPHFMGKEYTFSMGEKANLRKDLESWRGKKFTDEEARNFDIGVLLGKACLINVTAYTKQDKTEGVKVGTISPQMRGMVCPDQITPTQALTFEEFDTVLFESLPSFLKDKIKLSPEYIEMTQPKYNPPTQVEANQELVDNLFNGNIDESDTPF